MARVWCRADPIISFNNTPLQLWVEMPSQYQGLVNGPIRFDITTLSSVESEVLFTDNGFNNLGEEVHLHTDPLFWHLPETILYDSSCLRHGLRWSKIFPVQFDVSVPLDDRRLREELNIEHRSSVPVRVIVVGTNGRERVIDGTATQTIITVALRGTEATADAALTRVLRLAPRSVRQSEASLQPSP